MPRHPPRRSLVVAAASLVLLAASSAGAVSRTPVGDGAWIEDRWTAEDGLSGAQITGLAFDPAGTLWIATLGGLASFDGASFEVLTRTDEPILPTNRLVQVEAVGDSLWIVTELGHLLRLTDGVLTLEDRDVDDRHSGGRHLRRLESGLFDGSSRGLARLHEDRREVLRVDLAVRTVDEHGGRLFVGTPTCTVEVLAANGSWDQVAGPPVEACDGVHVEPEGGLLQLGDGGVWALQEDAWVRLVPTPENEGQRAWRVEPVLGHTALLCRDGSLHWADPASARHPLPTPSEVCPATVDGTAHRAGLWFGGRQLMDGADAIPTSALAAAAGFSSARRGPDGGLWFAQRGDVVRLRRPIGGGATLITDAGTVGAMGLLAHPDGGVWSGAPGGLLRVEGPGAAERIVGRADNDLYVPRSIWPLTLLPDGGLLTARLVPCVLREGECVAPPDPVLEGFADRLWAAAVGPDPSDAWFAARRSLWHGAVGSPLDQWTEVVPPVEASRAWKTLARSADGGLLAGSVGGGVLRVAPDGTTTLLSEAEGFASNLVQSVYVDARDVAWVGTVDRGLCRIDLRIGFSAETSSCAGRGQGLPSEGVYGIVDDDRGRLWLNTTVGVLALDRAGLEESLAAGAQVPPPFWLDERDGLPGSSPSPARAPSAVRDATGTLYFAQSGGVAIVDPVGVETPIPPAVEFLRLHLGSDPLARTAGVDLDPGHPPLRIRWAAVHPLRRDQVRFRTRLGSAQPWSDAGTGTDLTLRTLPPGESMVEVAAGLGGTWSEPARLVIRRSPTLAESAWFPWAVALLGAFGAGLLGWLRRRQLLLRAERLEQIVRDRTAELEEAAVEIQRGAARLAEVEALRVQLIANLSHELRTPLSLIVGPLDALAERLEGQGPEVERWLRLLRASGTRLTELLGQLLDVSRLDRGELALRARRLDLATFVRTTSERFVPAAASAGLDLAVTVPEGSLAAWFDPDLMDKAISNLLGNALKYTSDGSIKVRLEHREPFIQVEVEDTGPGIPAADQERLFARFERLEGTQSTEGAGIGLALARELVELHGGEVGVRSEVGEGSTFWIRLPTGSHHLDPSDIDPAQAEATPLEDADDRMRSSVASELPVLVLVEDHDDMRAFLHEQFERRFAVVSFGDAATALEACRLDPPSVVVSDVMMPGIDGIEFGRQLRADPATAHVPIVLLSALAGGSDLDRGLQTADDYITKPFHTGELLDRVGVAAGLPQLHERVLGDADSDFIDRARALVRARLGDSEFGVAEMAKELGYSRRQLLRLLKRLTGSSPSEFLLDHRLAAARVLLGDRALTTASEVAAAVGLSASYFSRVYRARFGTSPMARRSSGPPGNP